MNKYKYKTSKKSKQILNFQKRVSSATEFQKKIVAYIAQAFHDSKIIVKNRIVAKIEFPCFARNGWTQVFSLLDNAPNYLGSSWVHYPKVIGEEKP